MNKILTINQLEKSYKDHKAVKGIDFHIHKGEILCILGPNGAGKSSTIHMLTGALAYDRGSICYKGSDIHKDLRAYKKHLGIVPQDIALYEDLTAWQNLTFFASLYGLKGEQLKKRCQWALGVAGLEEQANKKVGTFSGGMKRRLNIGCAIAHKPELLIMDEPTVGIDPQSRNHILSSIKKLSDQGMTILYTTHYMEEVEEISTRIIIMDQGQIITSGTKETLKENLEEERLFYIEVEEKCSLNENLFYQVEGIRRVKITDSLLEISTLKGIENLDRIIGILIANAMKITNISCKTTSLETVFLSLTGKSLRD